MKKEINILVIEDRDTDFLLMRRQLKQEGLDAACTRVATKEEFEAALDRGGWDLVLSDYNIAPLDFPECLSALMLRMPEAPVILISGSVGEERAIELLKQGVWDFVLKDRPARLVPAIRRCLQDAAERRARREAEQQVRESEERYRSLYESSLDAVLLTVPDGTILSANASACRMFGYSEEELRRLGRAGVVDADDPRLRPLLEERSRAGSARGELTLMRKGGLRFTGEISSSVFRDRAGNIRTSMVIRDVTERKKAEQELQAAVRQWNSTFDAMNDAISIMDLNGTILRCNKAMIDLLDKYPQEITSHPCWKVVHQAGERIAGCPFRKMQKTRRRESMELAMMGRWYRVIADPIMDASGRLSGGVHIMTDITGQRQFEERLRESEKKYRTLVDNALVGVYSSNLAGRFLYVNDAMARIFEFSSAHDMLREDVLQRYRNPKDREQFLSALKRLGRISAYELEAPTRSGRIVNLLMSAVLDGDVISGMVLDMTDKKKLEGQLLQAQKMEAVGQLTSGIAHDFNNILSAIIGYASLLQMRMREGDPGLPFVDQILASSDRAANLTRSLLTFSRKQVTSLEHIDINENIRRVEKLLQRIIGEDIDLRTALASGPLFVNADSGQIEQALMNLATNARDAMQHGGILSVETAAVSGDALPTEAGGRTVRRYALISVADTGVGMDETIREKIFEPFFTTKNPGRGTGLGLSMVYGIIQQHEGFIHCYSEPGLGTTFKIYLPLLDKEAAIRETRSELPDNADYMRGSETILVAEDDEALRSLAATMLRDFGYRVIEAVDGRDAVERFQRDGKSIQLVLCDVIMPQMGGSEVRDRIKGECPAMPFVFMSGYPYDIINKTNLLEGADNILLKPFSPTALLRKVREALDQPSIPPRPPL